MVPWEYTNAAKSSPNLAKKFRTKKQIAQDATIMRILYVSNAYPPAFHGGAELIARWRRQAMG